VDLLETVDGILTHGYLRNRDDARGKKVTRKVGDATFLRLILTVYLTQHEPSNLVPGHPKGLSTIMLSHPDTTFADLEMHAPDLVWIWVFE
jgi:hypothetical protein